MGKSKNKFVFEYNGKETLSNFSFQAKTHAIGSEKNWGKVGTPTRKGNKLTLVIEADRDGAEGPATFYNEYVNGNSSNMIHTERGSNVPAELNFAVTGTLTINNDEFEVCLGQGHYALTNNWHLCSNAIIAQGDNKGGELWVDGKTLADQFYLEQSGSHTFKIKEVSELSGSHNNVFELKFIDESIEAIEFKLDAVNVTVGQPFNGVETTIQDGIGHIIVKAGRSKSKDVATWFNKLIDKGSSICSYTFGKSPDELNFAVIGTLKYTIKGEQITIKKCMFGQGSNIHIQNNWWFGGPEMTGLNLPVLGGGLGTLGFLNAGFPKLILCKTILETNRITMQFIKVKKNISTVDEITHQLLEV